jgi:hypothetical protein
VGSCYNSFKLPLHDELQRIAERLASDPAAVDALHALGFGTLVVDELRANRHRKGGYHQLAWQRDRFTPLERAMLHAAYAIESAAPVVASFSPLAAGVSASGEAASRARATTAQPRERAATPAATDVAANGSRSDVDFTFRNGSPGTYRHPDPIEPTRVRVRWYRAASLVREDAITLLLPLALAAGEEAARTVTLALPGVAGEYEVTLAPFETPDLVLARRTVQVRDGGVV